MLDYAAYYRYVKARLQAAVRENGERFANLPGTDAALRRVPLVAGL